jgi:hypothetical protein
LASSAQVRAGLAVNRELVLLYWGIGRDILERQEREGWETRARSRPQSRVLAGDLGFRPAPQVPLFFAAAGSARRQKTKSRGKLKMSPKFQKFRGKFKTTREDRKLWLKIQIVS